MFELEAKLGAGSVAADVAAIPKSETATNVKFLSIVLSRIRHPRLVIWHSTFPSSITHGSKITPHI
jgi:hypothetical protein